MGRKLSFLGLGVMGYPMAGHLARAGHSVTVYNRTASKARKWLEEHADAGASCAMAAHPAQAARGAEFVLACVGEDADLEAVCLGEEGAFAGMSPGAVFIDHSTVSAGISRRLAEEAASRGLGYLDAPISGGEAGARAGKLSIMCGGDTAIFEQAKPVLMTYAKAVSHLGPVGAGQTTKMVNQICIAGVLQGLAEAIHFCLEAGLDPDQVVEAIRHGAAQSWQMENRAATMSRGEFDFGFAVKWMRKDLKIVLDEARALGISLPLTALIDQFYADVERMGGSRQDTSSLIRRFRG
ncbi:MAG: NAD(P)-dependent oxidoreductase [Rhodothalassiaceae bacterium]